MIKSFVFNKTKVIIDFDNKKISSILFADEELIYGNISFFRVKLRNKNSEHHFIDGSEFEFVDFDGKTATYKHREVDVKISIEQIHNGLKWNANVKNHTDLLIEQIELMSIGLYPKLMDEGGKGEIDFPYNEGARVTSIARREASAFRYYEVDYPSQGVFSMFPNMVSSPFMSYIHEAKGIYLAMLDKTYTPKHIDFRVVNDALKTELSIFSNINYGEDYIMPFDCVMIFFEGNYFDACDLYREWFYQNVATNFKTIKEKYNEFPTWYHESPVVITYPVVGTRDSDLEMKPGNLYPYTNALPVIDYYAKKMDAKVMVTLMQWESTAPWAPPYVWPPYGDVDNFFEFQEKLHQKGHYLGVYTSGFGWTNKSFRREYDKTEEFEKDSLKDIVCTDSNGYMKSTTVCDIRFGYDVCPSQEKSKQLFINEANKMIDAGLDYIQILDQNHGGNPYFCYSDKHGHVPAPGSWQVEETLKLLRRIDKKQALFGCESAASEPYIGELQFSDNRYILNYHLGEPIPMYSYIYHEYVNNFMGNQICYCFTDEKNSFTYRIAYSFICGDMFTLIIDGNGKMHIAWCNETIIDDEMPLKLINNLTKWRTGDFARFLHTGKMVKPVSYKCSKQHFKFQFGDYIYSFDSVLSAAYQDEEDIFQFFVNYNDHDEEIVLDKEFEYISKKPDGKLEKLQSKKVIVPALSAIAIKIK